MYQATTPKHTFKLPIETDICTVIRVSYKQDDKMIIKKKQDGKQSDGMTLDGYNVIIKLSQEETLMFSTKKPVTVQIRAKTEDGDVYSSQQWNLGIDENQDKEIL